MANDDNGDDGPFVEFPGQRRATYTPRTRPAPDPALLKYAPVESLTDDEVVSVIDADVASTGDTLGAIQKLQRVLAVRGADQSGLPPIGMHALETAGGPPAHSDGAEPGVPGLIAPSAFLAEPVGQPSDGLSDDVSFHGFEGVEQPTDPADHQDAERKTEEADAQPAADAVSALAPLSVASVPIAVMHAAATGSHSVIGHSVDTDVIDDADDVAIPLENVLSPLASPRVASGEEVLFDARPIRRPVFRIEEPSLEPTPLDYRVGRAARMFWLWFAATASLVSVGIGAGLFALGISFRQLVIATFLGVALSFLPLGLGTLAGKWSGQPTMVVSRATFGVVGNVVPAVMTVITRVFWGAVLMWLVGASVGVAAMSAGWSSSMTGTTLTGAAFACLIAIGIAFFGYAFVARVQLVLTVASALMIVGLIVLTWRSVDVARALAQPDGDWLRVLGGAVIVFSFVGLAWANSSSDVARYQRPGSSGAASVLWAGFGAALPPFILVSYGGLLAASDPSLASHLESDPVRALSGLGLPTWYPGPLLAVIVVSLFSAIVLNVYSGGFALRAVGVRLPRQYTTIIVGALIAAGAVFLIVSVPSFGTLVTQLPPTVVVPVAAWGGIFSAEMMIRRRRFNPESLLRRGGAYASWRWVNLSALVIASALGFGLLYSRVSWLHWEGYLFALAGVSRDSGVASTDIGVLAALVLGLLVPFCFGIPAIRRQERARR